MPSSLAGRVGQPGGGLTYHGGSSIAQHCDSVFFFSFVFFFNFFSFIFTLFYFIILYWFCQSHCFLKDESLEGMISKVLSYLDILK